MKHAILIFLALWAIAAVSCNSKSIGEEHASAYEKAYATQFDDIISQLDHSPDYSDTLYTEMYIALKAIEEDDACGDIVLDRVSKLLKLDDDPENQRHYLEAASIVYSFRKDYDKFWETSKKIYDTYPQDSFQRLSSYAAYYSIIKQDTDSARYYISSAKDAALKLKNSDSSEDRIGYCIGVATLFVLEGNDEAAKSSIQEYISNETNKENLEAANELLTEFEQFKTEILNSGNAR